MVLMQQEVVQCEREELQYVQWWLCVVSGWGVLQLLWYLVFLQFIIMEVYLWCRNVQFFFICFSVWQYEGIDKLWVGLVIMLCEGICYYYGVLFFSVYLVLGNKLVIRQDCCQSEWYCWCCVCLGLLGLLVVLGLGVGLFYLLLGGYVLGYGSLNGSLFKVFGGVVIILLGLGLFMVVYLVGKYLFVSQCKKIEWLVLCEKFGSQLGFMCEVKKEVELFIDFLCFLEIYQWCWLCVVLEVIGLDMCYLECVVGLFNVINMLLFDSYVFFIFILVVDFSILVVCLESVGNMKGMVDNGYFFFNCMVMLFFFVFIMGCCIKLQFLYDVVQSCDDLLYCEIMCKLLGDVRGESVQLLVVQMQVGVECGQSCIDVEVVWCIQEVFFCFCDECDCFYEYVFDNVVFMWCIVNIVFIIVCFLQQQQQQGDFGGFMLCQVVVWVVFVNQWLCCLSWVLQCLEDWQQMGGVFEGCVCFWDVFCDNSCELYIMIKVLQNVFDLDGDFEFFECFLGVDFFFIVVEVQSLLCCMVNLDYLICWCMGFI